eukprot:11171596-Lingulodinium_polyedra.AAC.1
MPEPLFEQLNLHSHSYFIHHSFKLFNKNREKRVLRIKAAPTVHHPNPGKPVTENLMLKNGGCSPPARLIPV